MSGIPPTAATRPDAATIVRAWRDPKFARSLPTAIQQQLPPNPAGEAARGGELVRDAVKPQSGEYTSSCYTTSCYTTACYTKACYTTACYTTACYTTACYTSQCHSYECATSKLRCLA